MKWSWKVGRVGGVDLRVHASFLILLAWLALAYYREAGTVLGVARGVLFVVALFASVVLHELGHAFAGRRVGVPPRVITLLPSGGVARLDDMPDDPKQELEVALAGPAVTLVIVALLYLLLRALALPTHLVESAVTRGGAGAFVAQVMWVNVSLLAFNLLPAFPMDGGRVLRAGLVIRRGHVRATEIATRVGRSFALVFGIIGLLYSPFLVLIAVFVWLGAAAESGALQERSPLAASHAAH